MRAPAACAARTNLRTAFHRHAPGARAGCRLPVAASFDGRQKRLPRLGVYSCALSQRPLAFPPALPAANCCQEPGGTRARRYARLPAAATQHPLPSRNVLPGRCPGNRSGPRPSAHGWPCCGRPRVLRQAPLQRAPAAAHSAPLQHFMPPARARTWPLSWLARPQPPCAAGRWPAAGRAGPRRMEGWQVAHGAPRPQKHSPLL